MSRFLPDSLVTFAAQLLCMCQPVRSFLKCFSQSLVLLFIFPSTHAQQDYSAQTSKIIGIIIDSLSGQPIEYATVTVFQKDNTKPINGASTDHSGTFSIDNLTTGKYSLTVDFIGYKPINRNITLSANKPSLDLGRIQLHSSNQTLQDVTVIGRKALIENHIDKLVYNADKDITSQGGVATDILKKVPLVSVDVDGNVELQGSSSIQMLIDGKPSTIFGNNLADVLQAIPASQIKSIEVITSPGAKYDAEGTGGIINIILKNNKTRGINGSVTLSAGTRLENGSADLNARNDNFGVNASISGNTQLKGTTPTSLDRQSTDSLGNQQQLLENGQSFLTRNSYKGKIGFDWDLSKKDNLTGSASYNYYERNNVGYTNQLFVQTPPNGIDSMSSTLRNVTTHFNFHSIDSYLDYKKKFKKEDQELDLSYQSSLGRNNNSYGQTQLNSPSELPIGGANSTNQVDDDQYIIQADYIQPLKNDSKLELGVKGTFDRITGTSGFYGLNTASGKYEFDSSQINDFNYNRNIYAAYATVTVKLGKTYDLKLGGRYEHTTINAHFPSAPNTVIPGYDFLMPAVTISRSLDNGQTLKLSYTRRIQRPDYRDLNPFLDASDPTNINTGNPTLKPELVHYVEFAYTKTFDNGSSLIASLFTRYSTQDLQGYTYYYPSLKIGDSIYTNVAINTQENVGIQNVAGLNIYGNATITPKLTIRGSVRFYDLYIKNKLLPDNTANSVNYRTDLNITYQFSPTLVFETFGNFRSPSHEIQGSSTAFVTYSFAFRKLIWNKKGSIGFTTTDPFNQYVNLKTSLTGQNFSLVNDRKVPYRSFGISFSYKFGRLEFKKDKEEDNSDNN
jgi:ferric enterobactin receptor